MNNILSLLGAGCFGALIGWYVYYINRYRKGDVQLSDITTLIGVVGGGAATALFPTTPAGALFGAYGIGLFVGFFSYFLSLIYLVERSRNFDADWFLDGRRIRPAEPYYIPGDVAPTVRSMDVGPPSTVPSPTPPAMTPPQRPSPSSSAAPPQALPDEPVSAPADTNLRQVAVDACAARNISNAADINALFAAQGGFINWYNQTLANTAEFRHRGRIRATKIVADRFDAFWDQIPAVFAKPQITAIEFCALMSIGIQENSGDLWSNPEKVGTAGHPGLAYAFDRIPGLKISYNHANGNWSAFRLFGDAQYLAAHRTLPAADQVLRNGVSEAWGGEVWPSEFSPVEDASRNGFITEADFYKFRGRGIIQTTGRDDYKPLIEFILTDAQAKANAALTQLAAAWTQHLQQLPQGQLLDAIASISTNRDWNTAFGEALVLAAGVRIDSDTKGHYLDLDHNAGVLNAGTTTRGSLYFMARKINGGGYPAQVVPMMKALINAVADLAASAAPSRAPRLAPDAALPEEVDDIRPTSIRPWEELSPNVGDDDDAQPQNGGPAAAVAAAQWRVAKSLLVLRDQVNRKAPNRKKASDGTIGDAAHQTRNSDHNPWVRDGSIGVVTAMDVTHDPADGCDAGELAESIRGSRDARVKYLIWNRHILNSLPIGGSPPWTWRPYGGSNPHDHHVHISVKPDKADYDSTVAWNI